MTELETKQPLNNFPNVQNICFQTVKHSTMVENRSLEEEIMEDNMTSVMMMPDYVMKSKLVLEGVLLPIMAAFGFLGEFGV